MKWLMRGCFILALCFHTVLIAHAQPREPQPSVFNVSPEKGVHFNSSDGFMEFRMGFRLQQQLAITQIVSEQDNLQVEYLIRRERALFRGFFIPQQTRLSSSNRHGWRKCRAVKCRVHLEA